MNSPTTEHPLVADLLSQVESSVEELLANLNSAPGSVQAEDVLLLAQNEMGRSDLRACVFEMLRAFATCAFDLDFPDAHSRLRLLDVWERRPELVWVSQLYQQNVSLESLNPELLVDGETRSRAVSRLEAWLKLP